MARIRLGVMTKYVKAGKKIIKSIDDLNVMVIC